MSSACQAGRRKSSTKMNFSHVPNQFVITQSVSTGCAAVQINAVAKLDGKYRKHNTYDQTSYLVGLNVNWWYLYDTYPNLLLLVRDGIDCGTCIELPGCVHGNCTSSDGKDVPYTCNCHGPWKGALCNIRKLLLFFFFCVWYQQLKNNKWVFGVIISQVRPRLQREWCVC